MPAYQSFATHDLHPYDDGSILCEIIRRAFKARIEKQTTGEGSQVSHRGKASGRAVGGDFNGILNASRRHVLMWKTPFEPQGFGRQVYESHYAAPGETQWAETVKRIVDNICGDESQEVKDATFELINTGRFFPGGRTIRGWRNQYVNCFIFKPEDNVESIGEIHRQMYITSCKGGGTGYNASNLRPKGADIGDMKYSAPGVVSFAKSIDGMLAQVRGGGSRRAAILGAISINHPDVLDWITVKQTLGVLENHNISLFINDDFINAVKEDKEWVFTFNGTPWHTYKVEFDGPTKHSRVLTAPSEEDAVHIALQCHRHHPSDKVASVYRVPVMARELWLEIVNSNLLCGEPGILNESLIREYYAPEPWEPWAGCNPCTEAVTGNLGNCTLGSINLAAYTEDGALDFEQLRNDIPFMVRFLDTVLTKNNYPLPEQRETALLTRRIGLGVMGYAHMLIDLHLRYGQGEALEFTAELMRFIRDTAFQSSVELSKEKGSFDAFKKHKKAYLDNKFIKTLPAWLQDNIKKHGMRNAVLLSIAPTGTIGSLAGVSTSIEPIFAPVYERRWRNGEIWNSEVILDPKFKEGVNQDVCVGAYDVTPEEHMATIRCVQRYVDQSISKTINCPESTKLAAFAETLLTNVEGVKGVSVYLEGSRGFEPLKAIPIEDAVQLVSEKSEQVVQRCATGACEL